MFKFYLIVCKFFGQYWIYTVFLLCILFVKGQCRCRERTKEDIALYTDTEQRILRLQHCILL